MFGPIFLFLLVADWLTQVMRKDREPKQLIDKIWYNGVTFRLFTICLSPTDQRRKLN